jgi:hypothetical protein
MQALPFLRRARAVRWQLTLSTTSYALLAQCLKDEALLPMSTLLQTKCELHLEQRPPLPMVPPCLLELQQEPPPIPSSKTVGGLSTRAALHHTEIAWAAPSMVSPKPGEHLPFPLFHLKESYTDEAEAAHDQQRVEFNRSLLMYGFRRLEALERQREYEVLHKPGTSSSIGMGNALEPSILLTTLCATTAGPVVHTPSVPKSNASSSYTDVAAIWEEAGIGMTCAQMCSPDGRQIAVGCEDAAIRIFRLDPGGPMARGGGSSEPPALVLLGHQHGFPVFDVDWNRDGRALLSAGGDGSVRLWDTLAVGPFGEVAEPKPITPSAPFTKKEDPKVTLKKAMELTAADPSMNVPGQKPDLSAYHSGAALAVYRGHAPMVPLWSVAFAPSGYYFCSAGGDATARLWTTDRVIPVRLFTGHTSNNVNCVQWHPNCNYIITGGDDHTARLWDIHTGRTVRLLTGCAAGVNVVRISPCGRYAAGGDYTGVVHLWDLGQGQKVTEFHSKPDGRDSDTNVVHGLTFSACGTTLATGGDDGYVRLWDVRREALLNKAIIDVPHKSFATRRTLLMDLQYTKRNLLLSVGKYYTPIPLATPVPE